jgi:ssDNA-binding replication factor A large subunit
MVTRILDDFDGLVSQIREKSGWSETEIKQKISKKQENYGGLLTEAGAAYAIAKELGALENYKTPELKSIKLSEVSSSMNDVVVSGKVTRAFQPREWEKNGRKGKISSMEIFDGSATRRVVMWDDKADFVLDLKPADSVSLEHAYAKLNNGFVEIHTGRKTRLLKH